MPPPHCLAWQPSVTMNETEHPRVGVSECWLKLEAPIQLVSVTKLWNKRANFSILETQEGGFHSFFLSSQRDDRHRKRKECGKGLIT